jgi:hypothetical protein
MSVNCSFTIQGGAMPKKDTKLVLKLTTANAKRKPAPKAKSK